MLTGSRSTGYYDELFVRNPPRVGPLQSVTSLGGGGGVDISGKRDISDSYSRSETATLISASGYSESEANALFQTVSASTEALDSKRDVSDSMSTTEVGVLLDEKVDVTPYQNTLAGLATTTDLNAAITNLDDEIVTRLTLKLDKGSAYSTSEVDTLLADAASSTSAALSTKRDESESYSKTQVDTLLSAQPISTVTGLQAGLDAKASLTQLNQEISTLGDSVTTRMTGKRDKDGSYSSIQVDQLFSDAADSSAAALSTKRDENQSYTITQIDNLVSGVRAESYTAVEIDELLDTKHPTIGNNGSLDIAAIGQLSAALSSFQPLITSGNLSIAMTSGLQTALDTLATSVEAIPTSQIRVNGNWVEQSQFALSNGVPELDLGLGIWAWRALPLFSEIQRDAARILHARMGHLPLEVGSDCLCYFPRVSENLDMGPGSLNFVTPTADEQGEWGIYEYANLTDAMPSYNAAYRLFPNRAVPEVQVSSRGIGWSTTENDAYCIEFQAKRSAGGSFNISWTADADVDSESPDFITTFKLRANGDVAYQWQDRISVSEDDTESGLTQVDKWNHFAIQKPAGGNRLYYYADGLLIFDTDVTSNPPQNLDALLINGTGNVAFRELLVRSTCPFPLFPFSPASPVSFASVIGKGRFNSYML